MPADRAELTPAAAGDHGQPQLHSPLGVLPGIVEQTRRFVGAGRVRSGFLRRRRVGHRGHVDADVVPPEGAFQSPAEDVVDLPGGAAAQRLMDVALRRAGRTHKLAAVQVGVEALQQLGVQLSDFQIAEGRPDVQADEVLVSVPGCFLQLGDGHPLVDRFGDGDRRLGLPVEVDVTLQAGELLLRLGARLPGLANVRVPVGQRVDPGVDDGPVAA